MTTETYTDPREKLYNTVKSKGYYTKSFDEFKTQYSTPEQIDKIYSVVSGKKLYTKSKDEFLSQYFPQPVKKKESGVSPLPSSGEVSTKETEAAFPLTYKRDKGQMSADIRPTESLVPMNISQEQERQFNRLKRGFEDTTSPKVTTAVAETSSQKIQRSIQDGAKKDKVKDDSVLGGIYNTIVGSVSRLVGGMVETIETIDKPLTRAIDNTFGIEEQDPSKIVWGNDPNRKTGRELVTEFIDKARTASSSKANEQARSQFDITDGVQASDVKAMAFQAPGVLADWAAAAYTFGTSFFFQSVNDNAKELQDSGGYDKLTENEKIGYLFVQGTVQAALEKFGLNKILKATGLSSKAKQKIANEVTQEFIDKGIKATANDIEKAVLKKVSSMPNQIKRLGVKGAIGVGAEGGTEALQSAFSDGIKLLTNKISEGKPFNEEDITANFIKNAINAGAQGGVFGGAGSVGVGMLQNTNKAIREQVAKAQTPEDVEKIRTDIAEQVELGNLTEEEANAANITAAQYAKVAAKIPTEIDADKRYAIIGGIEQREAIKKEIETIKKGNENLDPAFHESSRATLELLEAKLEQTNDYLEGVIAGKKPTYRKEKPTTENGEEKYYKTSPTGEETKITKQHYDLATAVREEQAAQNKEEKELSKEEFKAAKILAKWDAPDTMIAMAEQDPLGTLKFIAEQAQGGRTEDMKSMNIPEEVINEAIKLYPATPQAQASEGAAKNVVPSTLKEKADEIAVFMYPYDGDTGYVKEGRDKVLNNPLKEIDRLINFYETETIPREEKENSSLLRYSKKNLSDLKKLRDEYKGLEDKQQTSPTNTGDNVQQTKPIEAEADQTKSQVIEKQGSGEGVPPVDPPKVGKAEIFAERPATELSFRGLQNVANEFGYEDVKSRDRVSDIKEKQNARETALEWAEKGQYESNIDKLLSGIENRELVPTAKQRLMLQDYLANESQKLREAVDKTEYDNQFQKVKRIKDVGQIARQEAGATLRIPLGGQSHPVSDYADAAVTMAKAAGVENLTEKQKEEVDSLVKNYEQKAKDAEAKVADLEAKLSEMEAAKEVSRKSSKKGAKKTSEQYKDERAKFREELKAAKSEHEKWLKEQGIQKMGVGLTLTPKMIKAIGKIAGSHIEEIGNNVKEVTRKVFEEVKDLFDGITETDIHDIVSGKYDSDYDRLWSIKKAVEESTTEIKEKTANKDFDKKEKTTWVQNKELKSKYPKLYKEALDALSAKEDAKFDYDNAIAKAELAKLKGAKKLGYWAKGVVATSKAIASGIDFSGIMMQNLVAMVAHPRSAAKALPNSFVDLVSDKSFTRWLTELHNSKEWGDIENSGLSITDPKSLKEGGKEEIFSGNLLDKEIKIKGKKYVISKYLTKPFERQFTSLGNRMRVNMFLRITERWKEDGRTFEKDPQSYKDLAKVLNTETGRGDVPEAIKKAHGLVNSVIWSPKLMSSRLNMLGISDLRALVGGKGYYSDLTPEIRRMAILDTVKFIGAGIGLMGFAAYLGAETDDDPKSPTFGTITIGNKTYNAWGGFTPYVKTIYQSIVGERRSGGKDKPTTAGELLLKFARSKMTPFAGSVTSAALKKDYVGKPTTIGEEAIKAISPLSVKGIVEGLQKDGVMGIITQGIPSIVGIGVTDQRDYEKPTSGAKKPSKPKRPTKPSKND
jgi:hypothetical protein